MNKLINRYRWVALSGYFLLMLSLYLLLFIFDKPAPQFMLMAILFYIGPLMLPLRGILAARAYTHAWAAYLALYYFIIGVWYAGAEEDRLIGLLITISSVIFFIGAIGFARLQGRANKLAQEADSNETSDQD